MSFGDRTRSSERSAVEYAVCDLVATHHEGVQLETVALPTLRIVPAIELDPSDPLDCEALDVLERRGRG